MAMEQDVAAARAAVRDLEKVVDGLRRHYRDSVDLRRLVADSTRLGEDLDLLCGAEPAPVEPRTLEIVEDREYPPDFFSDAWDEGVGRR